MIPKPLDQITEVDLNNLIEARVAERKTLEYKIELPQPNAAGKKEFLADISSFANTAGGDLIFGIAEAAGLPTAIPGVELGDVDGEILRWEGAIRTGLAPRVRQTTRAVPLSNGRSVLIFRLERSWYGPHRVIFENGARFYGRTTNGKYELDVTDLRNAFLFSNSVMEKVREFRSERIIALANGQTLTPLADGAKLVMHVMALESFAAQQQYDIFAIELRPMYATRLGGWGDRINFEGKIIIASGEPPSAYTQIFRNGVIEAVRVGVLNGSRDYNVIPSLAYEEALVGYLPECLDALRRLGCQPPVLIGISLLGVRGLRLAVDVNMEINMGGVRPIDREVLMLPEMLIDDLSSPFEPFLKPILDLVWNACGMPSSPHFDEAGHWIGRRW